MVQRELEHGMFEILLSALREKRIDESRGMSKDADDRLTWRMKDLL